MIIQIELWDLFLAFMSAGLSTFIALWALLQRMVFRPLDTIAKELQDVKEVFTPRIAVLENRVDTLEKFKLTEE